MSRITIGVDVGGTKTAAAVDLMSGAPSPVDARQLKELHLRIAKGTA